MAEQAIHIRASGGGFDVTAEPDTSPGLNREGLPSYRAARRAADALRIVKGWRIVDEVPAELREVRA